MTQRSPKWYHILVACLLYPLLFLVVRHIPNPMVPDAIIALNMIIPVLAGFLFGPISGAISGGAGTALSALVYASQFDSLAIFSHTIMGFIAGVVGKSRSEFKTAPTILIGHVLNIVLYTLFGLLTITGENLEPILLGLASEATVDVVAILFVAALLKKPLYCDQRL